MKKGINQMIAGLLMMLVLSTTSAQEKEWQFNYKPLSGSYELYSGELSEPQAPGKTGSSLSLKIEKEAAKQIFNQMGSDIPNLCPSEEGERMRKKNDLTCYKSKTEKYICYVGFDLKTGKSKIGSIC